MQNEISQSKKTYLSNVEANIDDFIDNTNRMVIIRGWGLWQEGKTGESLISEL